MVHTSGKSVAGMICGILSVLTSEVVVPGLVLGILGIIFSRKARKEIQKSNGSIGGEGMAIAGFVCGIVGLVLSVVVGLILAALLGFGIFVCPRELYW